MNKIYAIVAMDDNRVIGFNNDIPWHLPEDLKRFSKLTTNHSVLMGRKTFDSLPDKFKPLPNRKNIVASRNPDVLSEYKDVDKIQDLNQFLTDFKANKIKLDSEILWVIGGAKIYEESLASLDAIYLTKVKGNHQGDTFFLEFESDFTVEKEDNFDNYSFINYIRK